MNFKQPLALSILHQSSVYINIIQISNRFFLLKLKHFAAGFSVFCHSWEKCKVAHKVDNSMLCNTEEKWTPICKV